MVDQDSKDLLQYAIEDIRDDPLNEKAWADFYKHLRPRVAGILYRVGVGDREEIKDLCQIVFTRFIEYSPWNRNWRSLPDSREIVAYFAVVAKNTARTVYSKAKEISQASIDDITVPDSQLVEEQILSQQSVFKTIGDLNSEESELFFLLVEGYKLPEIANLLKISYSNAGVRVHRLREKLRKKMQEM
ncbi:MAG: sigma-70 family RNA polymerase sigma factor [Vulcanimicrobiota bacterium]